MRAWGFVADERRRCHAAQRSPCLLRPPATRTLHALLPPTAPTMVLGPPPPLPQTTAPLPPLPLHLPHCRYVVTGRHVGDTLSLDVLRGGQEMTLQVGRASAGRYHLCIPHTNKCTHHGMA